MICGKVTPRVRLGVNRALGGLLEIWTPLALRVPARAGWPVARFCLGACTRKDRTYFM